MVSRSRGTFGARREGGAGSLAHHAGQNDVLRPLERRPARQALVQQRPQRINVGRRPRVAHLARRLLRCHVRRRPHDRPRLAHVSRLVVDALGQPEIRDLRRAVGREQDVPRFQIAMDHPPQMGVVHGPRQRLDQLGRFARRRTLLLQLVGERAAVAELQGKVRLAAHLADLMQLHDVRVLQARHGFRLDLEAQPFGGAGVLDGANHLQGCEAIGLELARPVDDAHAAVAEHAEDLVAGDFRIFLALARRQARRNGPRVARPLRRGGVGRGESGRRSAERVSSTGTPRSERSVNRSPPLYRPVRCRRQRKTGRTCPSLAVLRQVQGQHVRTDTKEVPALGSGAERGSASDSSKPRASPCFLASPPPTALASSRNGGLDRRGGVTPEGGGEAGIATVGCPSGWNQPVPSLPQQTGPIQSSLPPQLTHGRSTQIVMIHCLALFDKWFLAKGMHNPG